MEILTNLFYQLIFSVGLIIALGLLVAVLRKSFCALSGSVGRFLLLIMGIVGTPIHELSHALMCLVFGHKVTEIRLYNPSAGDGTLGYVNHTYNPKNLYHQVGNFFIGTAPLIGGSCAILGLMYLLVPNVFAEVSSKLSAAGSLEGGAEVYIGLALSVFGALFNPENLSSPRLWLFFILAVMISSHMELSLADIKGGAKGFVFITLIMLAADTALWLLAPELLYAITSALTSFALSVAGFLCISLVFLLIMATAAFVFKLIF